jgi:mono/diheme cytochrome c family protein
MPAIFTVLGVTALVASSAPAIGADALRGEQLARRWCAACHIVAADQRRGADNAPSFASISGRPGFRPQKVTAFLFGKHPKMPDMALTRQEADDLAAYIARQKR